MTAPGRQCQPGRCQPIDCRNQLVAQQHGQPAQPIGLSQIGKREHAATEFREPGEDASVVERRERSGQLAQAVFVLVGKPTAPRQQAAGGRVGFRQNGGRLPGRLGRQQLRGSSLIADSQRGLLKDQVEPPQPPASLHLFSRRVEKQFVLAVAPASSKVRSPQPGGVHRRGQPYPRLARCIVDIEGQKELLLPDLTGLIEPHAAATDHGAAIV